MACKYLHPVTRNPPPGATMYERIAARGGDHFRKKSFGISDRSKSNRSGYVHIFWQSPLLMPHDRTILCGLVNNNVLIPCSLAQLG